MEGGKKKRSFDSFLEDLKEAAIAYSRQPINTISSNTTSPPLYTTTTTNTNTSTMMDYTMSQEEEEVMQQPWPILDDIDDDDPLSTNTSFFSATLPPYFSTPSHHHSSSFNGTQVPIHAHSSSISSSCSSSSCYHAIFVENKCMSSPSVASVVFEQQKQPKRELKRDEKEKKEKNVPKFMIVTRSPQVDVLEDGFQWRKYGKKRLKNNIYPRSYYKCTHKACYAQKRVERCDVNEEFVLTTYHGKHSHPTSLALPTHFGGYKTSLACE